MRKWVGGKWKLYGRVKTWSFSVDASGTPWIVSFSSRQVMKWNGSSWVSMGLAKAEYLATGDPYDQVYALAKPVKNNDLTIYKWEND